MCCLSCWKTGGLGLKFKHGFLIQAVWIICATNLKTGHQLGIFSGPGQQHLKPFVKSCQHLHRVRTHAQAESWLCRRSSTLLVVSELGRRCGAVAVLMSLLNDTAKTCPTKLRSPLLVSCIATAVMGKSCKKPAFLLHLKPSACRAKKYVWNLCNSTYAVMLAGQHDKPGWLIHVRPRKRLMAVSAKVPAIPFLNLGPWRPDASGRHLSTKPAPADQVGRCRL